MKTLKVGIEVDETIKILPDLLTEISKLADIAAIVKPQQAEQIEHEIALIVEKLIENGINGST